MTWVWAALTVGIFVVWFSTIWMFYVHGQQVGRAQALEDAIGGYGWLAHGPQEGTKIEEVARALALAQATLGKGPRAITPTGTPSDSTRLLAQTAIAAMRAPSREMNEAVAPYLHADWVLPFATYYDTMIDAALNPHPTPSRSVTGEGIEAVRMALIPFGNNATVVRNANGKG